MAKGRFLLLGEQSERLYHRMFWLMLTFLSVISVSSIQAAPRIVGGEELTLVATDAEYPWMVSLRDASTGEHVCGGTLVHSRWVMSASHCFYGRPASDLSVYVGDYDITRIEETEQRLDVISRQESGRDLMLLELAEAVDTEMFPPIRIATPAVMEKLAVGDMLVALGWGDREPLPRVDLGSSVTLNEDFPSKLHSATLPVFSQYDCYIHKGRDDLESHFVEGYLPIFGTSIDSKHICTGFTELPEEGVRGICQGDSGGPLLLTNNNEWLQVGVASFAPVNCGMLNAPDVFTRVSEFVGWVDSVIFRTDISVDTTSLSGAATVSILTPEENPGCGAAGAELDYQLKVDAVYPLILTNNASDSVLINDVSLDLEEIALAECLKGTPRALPLALTLLDDELSGCEGVELANGESCTINLKTNFLSPGLKEFGLDLHLDGREAPLHMDLSLNVIDAADFSASFGESVFLYQQRHNEWALQGEIVAELVSNLSLYEETRVLVKVNGSGEFSFDWKLDDADVLEVSVLLNGVALDELAVTESYRRETIMLTENKINTIEWVLKKTPAWGAAVDHDDRSKQVYLKAVRFVSDQPEEESDSSSADSGGGSVGLFAPFVLLFLAVFKVSSLAGRGRSLFTRFMFFCVLLMAGEVSADPRIVGGEDTKQRAFPWMVSLQNKFTGAHFCGATVIDPYWVMSAAHCYNGERLDSLAAVIGVHDLSLASAYIPLKGNKDQNAKVMSLTDVQFPEDNDDIVLFKLAVPYEGSVLSLASERDMENIDTGDSLTVIGWGDTDGDDDVTVYPNILQKVNVPLFDFAQCQAAYAPLGGTEPFLVTEKTICAGFSEGGVDSCSGDSGGPLLWKNADGDWRQVGVVSFGEGCAQSGYPGVYSRVASHKDWLEDQISHSSVVSFNASDLGAINVGGEQHRSLVLTSKRIQPFEVQWLYLSGSDQSGFQVVSDKCSDKVLYRNQSCEIALRVLFDSEGDKEAEMILLSDDTEVNQWASSISVKAYVESGLSLPGANGKSLITGVSGAWSEESEGEFVSKLDVTDDHARMGAYFSEAGRLSFEWSLLNEDEMNIDVYIDGVRQSHLKVGKAYSKVNLDLPDGDHFVEWVLARKSGASISDMSVGDAKVAQITFVDKPDAVSSGGGAFGFLAFFVLLSMWALNLKARFARYI